MVCWRLVSFLCVATSISACGSDPEEVVDPNAFALGPSFAPDPQVRTGMAGGPAQASHRSAQCHGWIPQAPSHPLVLSAPIPHLRIVVHTEGDPVLLVALADGTVLCNDDSEGLNSMVQGSFPAGAHQIFVGTYGQGAPIAYSVGVSQGHTLLPSTIAGHTPGHVEAPPQPPPHEPPSTPQLAPPGVPSGPQPPLLLHRGFAPDPQTQASWAGGSNAGSILHAGCNGNLPSIPQHTLVVRQSLENIRILVSSDTDTTLFVRAPDGTVRCNDDTDGLNPAVDGPLAAGVHQVFVGTYSQGGGAAYRLGVSTRMTLSSAELATGAAPVASVEVTPPIQPPTQPPTQPPPHVTGNERTVPGMMPGDMNPEGLSATQRTSADANGLSYYEAREYHRCRSCLIENDFDHCIYMCREPCLDCLASGASSERLCGPPCGGRRAAL